MITFVGRAGPAASSARGSAHRSNTARSATPRSPVNGEHGTNCRTRSLIRVLCVAASTVNRSVARTRRSNAATARAGSSTGCNPTGSTNGNRANVSASIPLLLACRDRNRRRSAALALDTRKTRCPRAVKNTATGNHAGPVGSITTSSTVPAGVPAKAAASTAAQALHRGLAPPPAHHPPPLVEHPHRVRAARFPDPLRPAVYHHNLPRVSSYRTTPAAPDGATTRRPRPQGWASNLNTAPTHALQPGPTSTGRPTSLIRGIRGQASGGNQLHEANRRHPQRRPSSETCSTPPHRTSRDAHATLEPRTDQDRSSLHETKTENRRLSTTCGQHVAVERLPRAAGARGRLDAKVDCSMRGGGPSPQSIAVGLCVHPRRRGPGRPSSKLRRFGCDRVERAYRVAAGGRRRVHPT